MLDSFQAAHGGIISGLPIIASSWLADFDCELHGDFSPTTSRIQFPSGHTYVELLLLLPGVTSALPSVKGLAFEDYPCFVAE
jgi:hypothetical protein